LLRVGFKSALPVSAGGERLVLKIVVRVAANGTLGGGRSSN
jgi:hypothetical protein